MICSMTPPLPDIRYSREMQDFAKTIEDPSQPLCHCGLHHAPANFHPYCLTGRQFYAWLEGRKATSLHSE